MTNATTEPVAPPNDGTGIDWNVEPQLPAALEKFNFWQTIAGVIMWVGYVIAFLVVLLSLITWLAGGKLFGRHVSEEAKQHLAKALLLGLLLGVSGTVWSWVIAG